MRMLTSDELQDYENNGFVVIDNIFTPDELKIMNEELAVLERAENRPAPKSKDREGILLELGLLSEKTKIFAEDQRILALIEDIVKPGIAIYSSKLVSKLPNNDTVCHWHQDDAYYVGVSASETRMSVWVPLLGANEKNGCLWIVPRSHKQGLLTHHVKDYGLCRRSLIEEEVDLSEAVPLNMKAGSILLFSALLWHGSKGNQTDQTRRAFIISYQEATAKSGNGKQWKILKEA